MTVLVRQSVDNRSTGHRTLNRTDEITCIESTRSASGTKRADCVNSIQGIESTNSANSLQSIKGIIEASGAFFKTIPTVLVLRCSLACAVAAAGIEL